MKIRRRIRTAIVLTTAALTLSGCGGVEPEKRDYPLALAWDYQEGNYMVIYGMANLSQMTAQDKGGEDTPPGLVLQGKDLQELKDRYAESQQYYLDLGHVQVVIFGPGILEDPKIYENVVEGMQQNQVLGKNAYVFFADEPAEVMKLSGQKNDTIGEYLTGIYENHMREGQQGFTLEDLYYDWNNEERIGELPKLVVENGQVSICRKR